MIDSLVFGIETGAISLAIGFSLGVGFAMGLKTFLGNKLVMAEFHENKDIKKEG